MADVETIRSTRMQAYLDEQVELFNDSTFIREDPISIPHQFSLIQDIEISAFFAAILAWGNRVTIIKKCKELMQMMDNAPYQFILHHQDRDLRKLDVFKHRTFNSTDLLYFISFFRHHYSAHNSLETAFSQWMGRKDENIENALNGFYQYFFSLPDFPGRTQKHIATPIKKSTCKRINMFLRWMVRTDNTGVDFGIWKKIHPYQLVCPIDLHVSRVSRRLGLLTTKQTNWEAALELTQNLKRFDPADPVKYDFALFGLGVSEPRSARKPN